MGSPVTFTAECGDTPIYGVRNPGSTASGVALEVDNVGPWLVEIDVPHHEIHEGEAFSYYYNSSLAAASGWLGTFRSASATYTHFRITGISTTGANTTINLYENVAGTSGTSASAAIGVNRNRASATTSSVYSVTLSGTTSGTTLLDKHYVGGGTGTGGAKSGGTNAADEEFILNKATVYGLHYNSGTADNIVNVRVFWYNEP